jgi:hypothetical protein
MATLPAIDDPQTSAGVQDLVAVADYQMAAEREAREKLVEEASKPDGASRTEFFGTNGDSICPCGYCRPSTQNLCQCGIVPKTVHGNDTPLRGLNGRSVVVENKPHDALRQSAMMRLTASGFCGSATDLDSNARWVTQSSQSYKDRR